MSGNSGFMAGSVLLREERQSPCWPPLPPLRALHPPCPPWEGHRGTGLVSTLGKIYYFNVFAI